MIPKRLADYREQSYWEERYKKEQGGHYDWLIKYENLKEILNPLLWPSERILILGCGNSTLSEKMHADGFINLTNIDYSETIIDEMRARTAHLIPPQEWLVMDMRRLLLPSESFEIVLDKASLDAIWTDGGSVWDPSKALRNDIKAVVDEVLRVLKPGGKFISISFGQPHFRKPLMERSEQWSLEVNPIDDTFYFLYIFTKY